MIEAFINFCWITVSVLLAAMLVVLVIFFVETAIAEETIRREQEAISKPLPDLTFDGYSRWELRRITGSIFRSERQYRKKNPRRIKRI